MKIPRHENRFRDLLSSHNRAGAVEWVEYHLRNGSAGILILDRVLITCDDSWWRPKSKGVPRDFLERCMDLGASILERPCWEWEKPFDNPDRLSLMYRLFAGLLTEFRQDERAIRALETGFGLTPGRASICHDLGYIYFRSGQYDQAIFWHERYLNIDPIDLATHLDCAYLLRLRGEYARAAKHLRSFIALSPPDNTEALEDAQKWLRWHGNKMKIWGPAGKYRDRNC